ncbi:MAG: nucleotidyltransferase family protein [Myxococcales bacterium]|nr:nucleotidyltransferase family protein [Myxococcales bacterium]
MRSSDLHLVCGALLGEKIPRAEQERLWALARQARVEEELARVRKSALGRRALVESAAVGALRLAEFSRIAGALRAADVEFAPLKGMAYALMFERGGPLRPMADSDILVREGDFARAGEVMQGLGFREGFPDPLSGRPGQNERVFTGDGMLVEIHRAFVRGPRVRIDYPALWARTLPLEREGIACRRLDADDTFLYHCFHFAIHEFALGGLRAVWELRRLILEDGPRLDACARRAREWGTSRALFCALRIYQECFPDPVERTITDTGSGRGALTGERVDPAAWAEAFAPPPPARALLERLVIAPSLSRLLSPGPLERPAQLLRKALLVDSLGAAAAYLGWYLWRRLGP